MRHKRAVLQIFRGKDCGVKWLICLKYSPCLQSIFLPPFNLTSIIMSSRSQLKYYFLREDLPASLTKVIFPCSMFPKLPLLSQCKTYLFLPGLFCPEKKKEKNGTFWNPDSETHSDLLYFSLKYCEIDIIIPTLQMRKLRNREVKWLAWDHTVSEMRSRAVCPRVPIFPILPLQPADSCPRVEKQSLCHPPTSINWR